MIGRGYAPSPLYREGQLGCIGEDHILTIRMLRGLYNEQTGRGKIFFFRKKNVFDSDLLTLLLFN